MTDLEKAARQALEVLERIAEVHGEWTNGMWAANKALSAIPTLRTAIEQMEKQEPVAWIRADGMKAMVADEKAAWIEAGQPNLVEDYNVPAYTTPPAAQRQWVWLEDKDFEGVVSSVSFEAGARWANIVLQEKNGENL